MRPYLRAKRCLDCAGAAVLMLLLAPLLASLALLVRAKLGRPALFRQERAGLGGMPFRILKFRSMTEDRDALGELLPDAQRLCGFGRWLRRTSLDELPQLWNVLRGDMSLVGPRPLYMDYILHYDLEQFRRLDVRPGITGLAQVSGRIHLEWPERLQLDVDYVDRVSLALDLRILLLTLKQVAVRADVPDSGVDPTLRFQGSGAPTFAGQPKAGGD